MKKLVTLFLGLLLAFGASFAVASAAVYVNGYYKSNGTYVAPHYRSSPDGNPYNNYSYPGNTNPYTGVTATGNPDTYLKNYSGGSTYTSGGTSVSSAPSYTTVSGGYMYGTSLNCDIGYVKRNGSCVKAPEHSTSYGYENFYCDSGYYKNGDTCSKTVPNTSVVSSTWECSYGYTRISGACISNDRILSNGTYCNEGTIKRGNSCVSSQQASNIDQCIASFGPNVDPLIYFDGSLRCNCKEGFVWDKGQTSCLPKLPKLSLQTASAVSSGQSNEVLMAQIEALLKTITELQNQLAALGIKK